jgi:hypothetical protein
MIKNTAMNRYPHTTPVVKALYLVYRKNEEFARYDTVRKDISRVL